MNQVFQRRWTAALPVLLVSLALSIAANSAYAQHFGGSIAMRWDNCYGDGGVDSRTFACDTNTGTEVLVVSAFPPAEIPQLTGAVATITVMTTGENIPDWWQLAERSCRGAALDADPTPPATSPHCADYWQELADASAGYGGISPSSGEIFLTRLTALPVAVPASAELFIGEVAIKHSQTVGAEACGGCSSGLCLGLENVRLDQATGPGADSYISIDPLPGTTSDVVGWQMSGVVMPTASYPDRPYPTKYFTSCQSATEAARPTWGAIKRMYR